MFNKIISAIGLVLFASNALAATPTLTNITNISEYIPNTSEANFFLTSNQPGTTTYGGKCEGMIPTGDEQIVSCAGVSTVWANPEQYINIKFDDTVTCISNTGAGFSTIFARNFSTRSTHKSILYGYPSEVTNFSVNGNAVAVNGQVSCDANCVHKVEYTRGGAQEEFTFTVAGGTLTSTPVKTRAIPTTNVSATRNRIYLNLPAGEEVYDNCSITVTNSSNEATTHNISTFAIDNTAPTLSAVTIASNNADTTQAKLGDEITVSITASESITTPTVTIAGQTATVATNPTTATAPTTSYTAKYTVTSTTTEGAAAINVAFSDAAGNAGTAVTATTLVDGVRSSVTVDINAPVVAEVTAITPNPTNDQTPNYVFSSTEIGTIAYGGRCSSATTAAIAGDNTITFNFLSEGTYDDCTITVTDSAGNASNVLDVPDFTINDSTPPTLSTVTIASNNADTTQAKVGDEITVSITASEAITAPTVTIAGQTATVATNPTTATAPTTSYTAKYTVTSTTTEGAAAINVAFSDAAGNAGMPIAATTNSSSVNVDRTIPSVGITTPISGGYINNAEDEAALTISGTSSGANGEMVTVNYGTYTTNATTSTTAATAGNWSVSIPSTNLKAQTPGTIAITANVSDAAGNTANQAEASVVYDTTVPTLPTVTIASNNSDTTQAKAGDEITVSITASESITAPTVTIAGQTATVATNPTTATAPTTGYTAKYTVTSTTAEGAAAINVAFSDAAGNAGTAVAATTNSSSVNVDRTIPSVAITTPISGGYINNAEDETALTISGTSSGANGETVTVNYGTYTTTATTSTTAATAGNWSVSIPSTNLKGQTLGQVSITANVSDAAGNAATQATASVVYDTTASTLSAVTIASNNADATQAKVGDEITVSITASEAITTPTVTIAGQTATVATNPTTATAPTTGYTAKYTVTSTTTEGAVAINVAFSDAAGNAGMPIAATTNSSSVNVDRTIPSVGITTPISGGYINNAEDEAALTISGTSSGANGEMVTVNYGTYTTNATTVTTSTPAATAGNWSVSIPSTNLKAQTAGTVAITANVSDAAGNAATQASASVIYDPAVPTLSTVTIASNNADTTQAKVGDEITVSITASEAITTPTVTIAGQTATVATNPTTATAPTTGYTAKYTVTSTTAEGAAAINVAFSDAAGNAGTAVAATTNSSSVTVDRTAPTIGITTPISAGYINNAEDESPLTISGVSSGANGETVTVNYGSYTTTATTSTTAATAGSWSVSIPSTNLKAQTAGTIAITANVSDAASNAATQATASVVYDQVSPTIGITTPISGGYINNAEDESPLTISGVSNGANGETVTVNYGSYTTNATTSTTAATVGNWSVSIPSTNLKAQTPGTIAITANVSDAASNAATQATATVVYDAAAPTTEITLSDDALKIGETSEITIKFSEVVSGFVVGDITTTSGGSTSGSLGTLSTSDSITYKVNYTPAQNFTGTVAVGVAADVAEDNAGNKNTAATGKNISVDTQAPTVTQTTPVPTPTNDSTPSYVFNTNEAGAISYGGSCASTTTSATVDDNTITFNALTNGTYSDCTVTVTDPAGNASTALAVASFTVDLTAPTATISVSSTSTVKSGDTATVTVSFSEAVSDFVIGDISVTANTGSLSNLSTTDDMTYTATFTPASDSTAAATIGVAANVAQDAAGNNSAAATLKNISVDTKLPTLTAVTVASNNANTAYAKVDDEITVSITASENITAPTVTIAGQSATVAAVGSSTSQYTAKYTVVPSTTQGAASIEISGYKDSIGNVGSAVTAVTNASSVTVDRTAPTATISVSSTSTVKSGDTATVTVNFSEAVSDFVVGDITVTANTGALSNLSTTDNITYTATFTPASESTSAATIGVAANVAQDAVGNNNAAAQSQTINVDTVAPTITIVKPISEGYINDESISNGLLVEGTTTDALGRTVSITLGSASAVEVQTDATTGAWQTKLTAASFTTQAVGLVNLSVQVSDASDNLATAEIALTKQASVQQTVASISTIDQSFSSSRYAIEDSLVTDKGTGLMWQQCSLGQTIVDNRCQGVATAYSWADALKAAHNNTDSGHSDWRLPNRNELLSLVATDRYHPSINLEVYPSTLDISYWSSSPSRLETTKSWIVDFNSGEASTLERTATYPVRLVRGNYLAVID